MRVNYAKKQSDVTAKMRGTFEESEKARREQRRVKELSKFHLILMYLEEKSIKMKKKLIDKLLKMRQDNEDNPLGRKIGKGGFGEMQTNTKLLVEGLT